MVSEHTDAFNNKATSAQNEFILNKDLRKVKFINSLIIQLINRYFTRCFESTFDWVPDFGVLVSKVYNRVGE